MTRSKETVQVRQAEDGDIARIADLCAQLGYPITVDEARQRLEALRGDAHHAVCVAVGEQGEVVGLVHVCVHLLVIAARRAEIESLVVDEGHRHRGIGRRLLAEAERWARQQGCQAVSVRSNVVRAGVREFYEGCGYRAVKAQWALLKPLRASE